jgi:hypothetical protein
MWQRGDRNEDERPGLNAPMIHAAKVADLGGTMIAANALPVRESGQTPFITAGSPIETPAGQHEPVFNAKKFIVACELLHTSSTEV